MGTACYGFGGNIKLRNSIAIPKGEERLLKSKINYRKIKSRYCSSEKALKIFQIIPFFITFYSFEGAFLEEVIIDGATCTNYLKKIETVR